MRVGKILRFGRTRTLVGVDIYNLFNANPGLTYQQAFVGAGADLVQPDDAADAAVRALQHHDGFLIRDSGLGIRDSSRIPGPALSPFHAFSNLEPRTSPLRIPSPGSRVPFSSTLPLMLRRSTLVLLVALCAASCRGSEPSSTSAPAKPEKPWFEERASAAGIDFVHFNGMSGERYYPEIMAPGVGLLDYDNDGDLDVYLVQGQMLGRRERRSRTRRFRRQGPLKDRLFRNDLTVGADGTRTLRFTDVTEPSGIDVQTLRHGRRGRRLSTTTASSTSIAPASPRAVLLHNNGNGTFTDVTAKTGVGNTGGWGVSASFVDYRSRRLARSLRRQLPALQPRRRHRLPVRDRVSTTTVRRTATARSRAGSIATAATARSRTSRAMRSSAAPYGPALGVSTADFNDDGWIDIYVGNDGMPNQLWINQKNGTFKDTAFLAGAAVNGQGNSEASMGIDAGDFDNDGDEDIFITNWLAQMNILYVNDGERRLRGSQGGRRALVRRAWPRPASAPPGSTTTTTPGSTS